MKILKFLKKFCSTNILRSAMAKNETASVLRDIQTLLRETVGDEVIVVYYETENFLPKGENYAGTLLKVDSVIKRTTNSPKENLSLVAKMVPTVEFEQSHFNSTVSFNKEMFVYETLIPAFKELEKEVGVKDEDIIDIAPKYYGGRLTMNEDKPGFADEDAVILMANLKEHGYNTMDRKRGLDLDHAKLALAQLARFHALSMAMKNKKPELFEAAKKALNACPYEMKENNIDDLIDQAISTICEDSRINQYKDRIRTNSFVHKNWQALLDVEPIEPWVSINHGDFWVNNIMFKEVNGQIKDVKFIDFQLTRISTPTKDLPYFLFANVKVDVINDYFDVLLDLYYNTLIKDLTAAHIDVSLYTRKSFDEELKKDAKCELLHCIWAIKFFTKDFDNNQDLDSTVKSITESKASSVYLERSWATISKFVEKDWI